MKDHFYFRIKHLKYSLGILAVLTLCTTKVSAQMYIDQAVNYDFYQFHEPLHIKNDKALFQLRIGITAYNSEDGKFKGSIEMGVFKREFYQVFPGKRFDYRFTGAFLSPIMSYAISEKLNLDAGFQFLYYNSKINGYGTFSKIGKGFRGGDIGFVAGGNYYFTGWFAVGTRFTPYFFRMLEYKRISDYGEFEPPTKDIYTQRIEVFVRFQFLNSMKK